MLAWGVLVITLGQTASIGLLPLRFVLKDQMRLSPTAIEEANHVELVLSHGHIAYETTLTPTAGVAPPPVDIAAIGRAMAGDSHAAAH